MLKKKNFWNEQKLLKFFFKRKELFSRVVKSFSKNHKVAYINRIYFLGTKVIKSKLLFLKSRNKLLCLKSLNKRVHNKKFLYSRFYLNKHLNKLRFFNTWKC